MYCSNTRLAISTVKKTLKRMNSDIPVETIEPGVLMAIEQGVIKLGKDTVKTSTTAAMLMIYAKSVYDARKPWNTTQR